MEPYYQDDWLTILHGDAVDMLRTLPDESVHCVVTSPPYWGLRDYGTPGQLGLEATPGEFVANMVAVFREVRRVLRSDGTLWLNMGDCYATGAGSYRNPGSDVSPVEHGGKQGYTRDYARAQPNRMPLPGLKPKDLIGMPWRLAFALQADGWFLRSDIIWAKPNPMPESVTDRPTKSHEYLFLLSKSAKYFFDADAVRELDSGGDAGNGFAGRQGDARQTAVDGGAGTEGRWRSGGGRNLRDVWTIATEPYPGAHFATFPQKLVEPCIKAGCPESGTVLDPFAGTGTTGLVAQRLSRRAVLIDLSVEYLEQCLRRNVQVPLGMG